MRVERVEHLLLVRRNVSRAVLLRSRAFVFHIPMAAKVLAAILIVDNCRDISERAFDITRVRILTFIIGG